MQIKCDKCGGWMMRVDEVTGFFKAELPCRRCNQRTATIDAAPGQFKVTYGPWVKKTARVK